MTKAETRKLAKAIQVVAKYRATRHLDLAARWIRCAERCAFKVWRDDTSVIALACRFSAERCTGRAERCVEVAEADLDRLGVTDGPRG